MAIYSIVLLVLVCAVHVSLGFEVIVGESCSGTAPGMKFVNIENCRSYITCSSGRFRLFYCPSGFFNPAKNDCDLDYKCVLDNLPKDDMTTSAEGEGTPSTILSTLIPSTIANFDSTTNDWLSSTPIDDVMTNPTTGAVEEATTEEREEETTSTTTSATTTTTTLRTSTELASPSTPSVGDRNECPLVDSDEPTYLTDKHSCEKYHLCYRSEPIEMRCISGMFWNSQTNMCDFAQNVNCWADVGNPDANLLPECDLTGLYSMPHPYRCDYFIMCMDGRQTVQQCDAFHRWDVISQKCLIKDRATCILDVMQPV